MIFKRFLAILLLAAITACSALGTDSPKTFNEQAAAAQITVTSTRSMALQLLEAGKITAADAKNAQAAADAGNVAIDIARQYAATDPTGASAKLTSAVAIVTAVQAYLTAKKGSAK